MATESTSTEDFLNQAHFYIMWFSVLCSFAILINNQVSLYFRPNVFKIILFVFLVFSGFSFISNASALKNFPDFSSISEPIDLLKAKHSLSKLQRDVYLQAIETFSILLLLLIPRYQQYYEDTLNAFNRRFKELSGKDE